VPCASNKIADCYFMPETPAEKPSATRIKESTAHPNESLICDICGRFGAVEFGDRLICPDCYGQNCGSCCPEFGQEKP
jgi:hypothetical protein